MSMKMMLTAALAVSVLNAAGARAGEFYLENLTGGTICELRLSAVKTVDWREDLLAGSCLKPEGVRKASGPTDGLYDLLAIFDDGGYYIYYSLDLKKYAYLKLRPGEAELFEWNPADKKPLFTD